MSFTLIVIEIHIFLRRKHCARYERIALVACILLCDIRGSHLNIRFSILVIKVSQRRQHRSFAQQQPLDFVKKRVISLYGKRSDARCRGMILVTFSYLSTMFWARVKGVC
jgi:hypothetical protein